MPAIRKPKIGLTGVMCTPFRGNKEANYKSQSAAIADLASDLEFDLHTIKDGIYDFDQASRAASELEEWGADFILLQTASFAAGTFVYPFTNTTARLGLWAVPEGPATEEGGLPLNSFTAANLYNSIIRTHLTDYPWPVKWFFGNPGQRLLDKRLEITVSALRALINLRGARIGLIGGVAPSFDNLIIDERTLKARLDISVEHIEFDLMMRRVEQVSKKDAESKAAEIRKGTVDVAEDQMNNLRKSGKVNLAIEQLTDEHNLDAVAVSCWPRFQSDYHLAVCTVMGSLNSSSLIAACEGDVTSAVSMLALKYLTNGNVVTLMDLATVDQTNESVLLWHCGPTPPSMADENGARMQALWLFDGEECSRTGLHNVLVLKPGAGTVLGFGVDFDKMLILGGEIDTRKPDYAGSKGWFHKLKLNNKPVTTTDLVQTIMVSGFQHHYPFVFGDHSAASLELCSWLGIQSIQTEKYCDHI